jgi:hypothetical protein
VANADALHSLALGSFGREPAFGKIHALLRTEALIENILVYTVNNSEVNFPCK